MKKRRHPSPDAGGVAAQRKQRRADRQNRDRLDRIIAMAGPLALTAALLLAWVWALPLWVVRTTAFHAVAVLLVLPALLAMTVVVSSYRPARGPSRLNLWRSDHGGQAFTGILIVVALIFASLALCDLAADRLARTPHQAVVTVTSVSTARRSHRLYVKAPGLQSSFKLPRRWYGQRSPWLAGQRLCLQGRHGWLGFVVDDVDEDLHPCEVAATRLPAQEERTLR